MPNLNVAIIGAGQAGLCCAKYSVAHGFNVTIYEQGEQIGGIWHYTEKTGKDQYGVNIHTAMYQGLRTNVPHQVMEYSGFPYPKDTMSFPSQSDVLNYLHSYADHFDLKKLIKFSHLVVRVAPVEHEKWEIIVKNLPNNSFETKTFDAVFICNGHYSVPHIPEIPDIDTFKGKVLHSHDFRKAEPFRDARALVIGAGPSGLDLVAFLTKVGCTVTFSQNKIPNERKESRDKRQSLLPPKATLQDNVKCFTSTGAEFIDGSHQSFDVVFFATGYIYSFPFLSADCGIHVDNNFVQPLYKKIFNIHHPTMAFISIPSAVCTNPVCDLQVRFAMKFISGAKKLPSKSEMMLDMRAQTQILWDKGYSKDKTHFLGPEQMDYCKQLSEAAEIENIPQVLFALFSTILTSQKQEPFGFRNYKYTIIDEKTFNREKYEF